MGKDEEGGVAVLRRLTKTQIHTNLDRQDCEFILGQFLVYGFPFLLFAYSFLM